MFVSMGPVLMFVLMGSVLMFVLMNSVLMFVSVGSVLMFVSMGSVLMLDSALLVDCLSIGSHLVLELSIFVISKAKLPYYSGLFWIIMHT